MEEKNCIDDLDLSSNDTCNDSTEVDVTLTEDYSYDSSTCTDYEQSVTKSSDNAISPDVKFNGEENFNGYENEHDDRVTENSWGNKIKTNSYQSNRNGHHGSNYGRKQGQLKNFRNGNSNNSGESESGKPTNPKSTYIPPEFEVDNNITIEVGSNFKKYDTIEVTVSGMEVPKNITSFPESGLCDVLLNNLERCHYTTPTPIQKYALPIIMDGRDMIASAQTGSGKTVSEKIIHIIFV